MLGGSIKQGVPKRPQHTLALTVEAPKKGPSDFWKAPVGCLFKAEASGAESLGGGGVLRAEGARTLVAYSGAGLQIVFFSSVLLHF